MQNVHAFRNYPKGQRVSHPMCQPNMAVKSYLAVAIIIPITSPKPARLGLSYPLPEPVFGHIFLVTSLFKSAGTVSPLNLLGTCKTKMLVVVVLKLELGYRPCQTNRSLIAAGYPLTRLPPVAITLRTRFQLIANVVRFHRNFKRLALEDAPGHL
jgi:hypothetical protein